MNTNPPIALCQETNHRSLRCVCGRHTSEFPWNREMRIRTRGSVEAMERPPQRFAVALSFPGEARYRVSEIASLLAGACGRDRILYDRFHEAEFALISIFARDLRGRCNHPSIETAGNHFGSARPLISISAFLMLCLSAPSVTSDSRHFSSMRVTCGF